MKKILSAGTEDALPSAVATTEQVGNLVQRVRKEQQMTQFDLASLAGCGNRFLVELEKGKQTVQMQKVLDVLALLGLEVVIRKKGS